MQRTKHFQAQILQIFRKTRKISFMLLMTMSLFINIFVPTVLAGPKTNSCSELTDPKARAICVEKLYQEQNIENLEVTRPCSAASASAAPGGSSSNTLYMLGDSLTVGMKDAGIEKRLTDAGWTPTINARQGRPLAGEGITELNNAKAAISEAGGVVVGLGTNDAPGSATNPALNTTFEQNVNAAMDIIKGSAPKARVFWINLLTNRGDIDSGAFNATLQAAAGARGFTVIDWAAAGPSMLGGDGIHPTAHYPELVNIVTSRVGASGGQASSANLSGCSCSDSTSGLQQTAALDSIKNLPEYWSKLISEAAAKYPDVDPRLVATTLWVENRGWPDPNKKWAVSSAGAGGPWQFIPSSWASMGRDGDGDGIKDRNNPRDAVLGAFEHQRGSAGKPIAAEYDGNAEESFKKIVFRRDNTNLLSFASKYNGSGAPSGVTLDKFPRKENADYVVLSYWLLATNFQKTWNTQNWGVFVDAKSSGKSSGNVQATTCGGDSSSTTGQIVGGYAWPVDRKFWDEHQDWFTKKHHDYAASDIPVPSGTPVYSITPGTVTSVSSGGSCGTGVQITEPSGAVLGYCHGTPNTVKVTVGATVTAGQHIMDSDNTGSSTGPHLHVQIKISGTLHCPQGLFKAMGAGEQVALTALPTTGCAGGSL